MNVIGYRDRGISVCRCVDCTNVCICISITRLIFLFDFEVFVCVCVW